MPLRAHIAMESRAAGRWTDADLSTDLAPPPVLQALAEREYRLPEFTECFKLPAAPPALDRMEASILVVDDDAQVRGLMAETLMDLGYRSEQAESVHDAWNLLQQGEYDLVISDYEMPGATGINLLELISERRMDIGFIMLTAHKEIELARHSIKLGALDFLTKPFEFRQLSRLIELNLERRRHKGEWIAQITNDVLAGTIRSLVAAVDAKDPYTATHSQRVMQICSVFGRELDLRPNRLAVLEFAALLHDIGKIAVPEAVLRKPGLLTREEWELFKLHPVRSAQTVGQVACLTEVARIVLHHHERIDGDGYPEGLVGDSIPYLSRVITIADAYEALTAQRAYRDALPPGLAREVIASSLGAQFDRHLGEVFLSIPDLP